MKKIDDHLYMPHPYKIIPDDVLLMGAGHSKSRAAVFMNLYYEEQVAFYFNYLESVPKWIDVYIISSKREILEQFQSSRYKKLLKNNRGRDISALLVASRPYIDQYDFFCFGHDKREKSVGSRDFIREWKKSLVENTLISGIYIENVIATFESDDRIGMMAPPPQHGTHRMHYMRGEWGPNFDNTKKLAHDLGLSDSVCDSITKEEPSITYGTTFWARSHALKKLFDKEWKYEDFPPEPMADDGEINHAIERMLQYVVEDAGYTVKLSMAASYAAHFLNILRDEVRTVGDIVRDDYQIMRIADIVKWREVNFQLYQYCQGFQRVYLYGAGQVAESCLRYIGIAGILPAGIIVTGRSNDNYVRGLKVYSVDEFDWGADAGIVVAVGRKNKVDVINTIEEKGRKDYLVYIDLVNRVFG